MISQPLSLREPQIRLMSRVFALVQHVSLALCSLTLDAAKSGDHDAR